MVVLRLEHQRAGGTHRDAVAAVDAGGVGQLDREFGRDPGVEAAARDGERVGVLKVLPAGLDALVAQDALAVVPDVQLVVHLHRLRDGGAILRIGRRVMARLQAVAHTGGRRRSRRAVPLPVGVILRFPAVHVGRGRQVHRRSQELEHHLPAVAYPLGVGPDHHAGLDLPRARRHQDPGALDLHHADPAHVDRVQGFEVAEGRDLLVPLPARFVDRGAFGHLHRLAVDLELDGAAQRLQLNERGHRVDPSNR